MALAQVHGPAGQRQAHAHLSGRLDDGVEHGVVAAGNHVVVVEDRGGAAEGQLGQAHPGSSPHVGGIQPPPDGVQRHQPAEQVAAVGAATRHPLVEVVVGVHEARGDDVAVAADHLLARLGGHVTDRRDATGLDGHVAGPRPPRSTSRPGFCLPLIGPSWHRRPCGSAATGPGPEPRSGRSPGAPQKAPPPPAAWGWFSVRPAEVTRTKAALRRNSSRSVASR